MAIGKRERPGQCAAGDQALRSAQDGFANEQERYRQLWLSYEGLGPCVEEASASGQDQPCYYGPLWSAPIRISPGPETRQQ
jgi:hypothetical protein